MSDKNQFIITRSLNAPRELVWKVWTEPEHLRKWLSPQGAELSVSNMDFRVGGLFHYCMKIPDGSSARSSLRNVWYLYNLFLIPKAG